MFTWTEAEQLTAPPYTHAIPLAQVATMHLCLKGRYKASVRARPCVAVEQEAVGGSKHQTESSVWKGSFQSGMFTASNYHVYFVTSAVRVFSAQLDASAYLYRAPPSPSFLLSPVLIEHSQQYNADIWVRARTHMESVHVAKEAHWLPQRRMCAAGRKARFQSEALLAPGSCFPRNQQRRS